MKKKTNKTHNLKAVYAYLMAPIPVIGLINGVLMLLFIKKDKFVRFHAMQSIIVCGLILALNLLLTLNLIGMYLIPFALIAEFALFLFLMMKAYLGVTYKIPFIGSFSQIQLKKLS